MPRYAGHGRDRNSDRRVSLAHASAQDAGSDRRERRKRRARRELAEAAIALFEKNGFAATTVEEIANAADFSESTFFRHFPRKEDAVFYDLSDRMEAMLADFGSPDHDTAWITVREAFVNNARAWESTEGDLALARIRLFHQEPALIARYLEYCLEWEDAVAEIFARERGGDAEADLTCRLIAGASVSAFRAAFRAYLADPSAGLAEQLRTAFGELEAGLGAHRPPASS